MARSSSSPAPGGGLRSAFARRFAQAGAHVGLLDVDGTKLGAIAAELGGQGVPHMAVPCDVTDETGCRAALEAVRAELGGIDAEPAPAHAHRGCSRSTSIWRRGSELLGA